MSVCRIKHLYIDGDMLVYTLGYASEKRGKFADGAEYKEPDLPLCYSLIKKQISNYIKLFGVENYTLVLSGTGNWRTEFYPEYKANRVALIKPLGYTSIRSWMIKTLGAVVIDGEEADDWLADKMTGPEAKTSVVISADKDFFTVPGNFYHLSSKRLYNANPSQSLCFLFFQALSGDRVDGYFGVKWLGKTKVTRLLRACHGKTIRQAYLLLKKEVLRRGETSWDEFRLCLDLAALRWNKERGIKGIGIRRVFQNRARKFEYCLPYYDLAHNAKYGQILRIFY